MTLRIFKPSFWTFRKSSPSPDSDRGGVVIFGYLFLAASLVTIIGMVEPQWFKGLWAPAAPRQLTKAEQAWAVLASRRDHERRLCADRDAVMSAEEDLKEELAWSEEMGWSPGVSLDALQARQKQLFDCLDAIAPLPPPPPPGE